MSAPDNDINTQKRRHRGPLIGMALVAIFGVALIAYWLLEESATADNTEPGAEQTEGAAVPMENVEEGTLGGADPVADPGAGATQTPGPAEEGTAPVEQ